MYPLLKRDGLALPTLALTLFWNFALGSNPFAMPTSLTKYLSLLAYAGASTVLFLDTVTSSPAHLPDLYVVLNVLLSCAVFGLGWLWSLKRLVEEAWGLVGLGGSEGIKNGTHNGWSSHADKGGMLSHSPSDFSIASFASDRRERPRGDERRVSGEADDQELRRRNNRRSASVASAGSSHTARRSSRRSPLVSPDELAIKEDNSYLDHQRGSSHLLPPSYSSASMRSASGRREGHHRSPSAGSANSSLMLESEAAGYAATRRKQGKGFMPNDDGIPEEKDAPVIGLGDISTHVSPSKTMYAGAEPPRQKYRGDFDGQNMKLEEERWRQGMLREFD